MVKLCLILITSVIVSGLVAQQPDSGLMPQKKALLVYDAIDTSSKIYIETFRKQLDERGIPFDEAVVAKSGKSDVAKYEYVFVYSRVMGLNMISPVKKWLGSLTSLKDKKIFIFVTANRWFDKDNLKQVVALVNKRGGTIVDAVSIATQKLSSEQKSESVVRQVEKVSP